MADRFDLVVEALADAVPAPVRLKALLKLALRRFRLRCVRCVQAPAVDAWVGWRRDGPGSPWAAVCCAADPSLCRELVFEHLAEAGKGHYVVIPKGAYPCAEPFAPPTAGP